MTPFYQTEIATALESVFGHAWHSLTFADQQLIVKDCTEDGGVQDFAAYRRNIGTGNLQSYANVMRVRFTSRNR